MNAWIVVGVDGGDETFRLVMAVLMAAALLPDRRAEALPEGAHFRIVRGEHVGEEGHEEQPAQDRGRDDREAFRAEGGEAPGDGEGGGPAAVHRASRIRGSITA